MFTRTFQSIADDAKARADRMDDPSVENETLAPWLNQEARKLAVLAAQMGADEFTKTSSLFTVGAGGLFTIAASGGADAATDFLHLRGVDLTVDNGQHFKRLRPWKLIERDRVACLSYRLTGRTLRILPVELAQQYPLRYWYVFRPTEWLSTGDPPQGDSLDLPIGGDDYIAEGVAAKIRIKNDEDPIYHLAAQKAALDTMQRWFAMSRQGEPEPIREADAEDNWDDLPWR